VGAPTSGKGKSMLYQLEFTQSEDSFFSIFLLWTQVLVVPSGAMAK
jgi:hypothetical protein